MMPYPFDETKHWHNILDKNISQKTIIRQYNNENVLYYKLKSGNLVFLFCLFLCQIWNIEVDCNGFISNCKNERKSLKRYVKTTVSNTNHSIKYSCHHEWTWHATFSRFKTFSWFHFGYHYIRIRLSSVVSWCHVLSGLNPHKNMSKTILDYLRRYDIFIFSIKSAFSQWGMFKSIGAAMLERLKLYPSCMAVRKQINRNSSDFP